ncbi:MAG: TIGR03667 family PPOX class F420-dependent oxidoreductase [Anaerolineae bacterium]|nr:TIGR03667 family PPOX class F420-dependent oxidoreductase [Anaerolineae bacterium]
MLDFNSEFGRKVAQRLQTEHVVWLTTVASDGTPQPRPVWFLWNGETFLIFSQPDTYKLKHIARNRRVSLHLNSDEHGGGITVITGDAHIAEDPPFASDVQAYMDKYRDGIKDIGMTPADFTRSYSVAIRVKPVNLRGF